MDSLNQYIVEKLRINKDSNIKGYTYHPKDSFELRFLIKKLLKERGNNADLNDIDVSNIDILSPIEINKNYIGLFEDLDPHNIDISEWNVSNAKCFGAMFYNCKNFNSNLSNWDMSKAKYINTMFYGCENYDGKGLDEWNISKIKEMNKTFIHCRKEIIPSWYKE